MDQDLTDHQQRCFEHICQARTLKMSLSAHARCHGLDVRMLYDAVVRLVEKGGVIAGDVKAIGLGKLRSRASDDKEKSAFVAVRIEPAKAQNFVPVLRLNHIQGCRARSASSTLPALIVHPSESLRKSRHRSNTTVAYEDLRAGLLPRRLSCSSRESPEVCCRSHS
jgi:hypothetical protein